MGNSGFRKGTFRSREKEKGGSGREGKVMPLRNTCEMGDAESPSSLRPDNNCATVVKGHRMNLLSGKMANLRCPPV